MKILSHALVGIGSFILGATTVLAIFVNDEEKTDEEHEEDEAEVHPAYPEDDEEDEEEDFLSTAEYKAYQKEQYNNLKEFINSAYDAHLTEAVQSMINYTGYDKTPSQTASGGLTVVPEEDDMDENFDPDHKEVDEIMYENDTNLLFEDELPDEELDPGEEGWTESIIVREDGSKYRTTKSGKVDIVPPFVISEEEYDLNEHGFTHTTLDYYMVDDVLVTDRNEIIANQNELVGDDTLKNFEELSDESMTLFVRNTAIGIDFEVSGWDESYFEDVLGKM